MVIGEEALDLAVPQPRLSELRRHIGVEQLVAVLGERRVVPDDIGEYACVGERERVDEILVSLDEEFARLYEDTGRQLMDQIDCNLLFRWFVGLGCQLPRVDEGTPVDRAAGDAATGMCVVCAPPSVHGSKRGVERLPAPRLAIGEHTV